MGRIQAATGQAVDTLVAVASLGRRDSDRVRAAVALLEQSFRGLSEADLVESQAAVSGSAAMGADEVIQVLSGQLQQVARSDLPVSEKSRLSASLADALLRAIGVGVISGRLETLQGILQSRNESKK